MQYRDGFNKQANENLFSRVELYIDKPGNKGQPYTAKAFFHTEEPIIRIRMNDLDKYVKVGERLLQHLAPVEVLSSRISCGCIFLSVKFFGEIDTKKAEYLETKYLNVDLHWGK